MRMVRLTAVLLAAALPWAAAATGKEKESAKQQQEETKSRLEAGTFSGLELRGIGPALMSGRIADIAVDPRDQSTWYVAVGSGGVWKTTNAGITLKPIFDGQGSYSIGCVTIDPSDSRIVWVGTGENVSGRHVGYGDGVYRSLDGGKSWSNLGLGHSEHIGRIVVDPRDSNVVYVAAQGPLWSGGGDRGLYKTVDGGTTWEKVLGGGEYTGVNEVVMDPRHPDVLYASTHQRLRTVAALIDGGPESGIHKSTDGGKTWRKLTSGLPGEDLGKIGLAISPQQPDVVYATIELAHQKGGFYRSADGGESWEKRNDYVSGGTGPHYYQEIYASPHQFDRVYQMDVRIQVSDDGGKTFERLGEEHKHSDNHALAFDPADPEYLLAGCDGGLYESHDHGKNWRFLANLPVTQFYKVAVDNDTPFYNVYGGTQDNSTQGGPSRTGNASGIRNSDWVITVFADGHQPAVDPGNPDIVYSEWQQGNLVRYDRKTGEIVYIQPQPGKGEPAERFNWDSPILVSPHDPARLYYASQRVWRSDDRGDSWRPVSGDLTRDQDRLKLPMMGRVWSFDAVWDLQAMSFYGTITSLAESPRAEGLIYAGTDDGLVQVSEDGGANWRRVDSLPGVPEGSFVNDIKADLHDADTVYVALDNHKRGDFKPYLLKSTDRGRSWKSIAGDLADRNLVWRLVQDHERPELLFAGTELGIFFTLDGGGRWIRLSGGVPTISFRDLAIQRRDNDLVGASFGRSFWILDDYSPLRLVSAEQLERPATLFPVRDAWWYIERHPLGDDGQADQGAAFFTAPNPPFGAVFTYYLRDELKTRKAERREAEKEIEKKGGDTPYPGFDELRAEGLEEDPAILLTVRDEAGNVVRRLTGPVGSGFHRVSWDLRYPIPRAVTSAKPPEDPEDSSGILAAPGTYTVELAQRLDGAVSALAPAQPFHVAPMTAGTLPGMPAAEMVAFYRQTAELFRVASAVDEVLDRTAERLATLRNALTLSTVSDTSLDDEVRALDRRLADIRLAMHGNEVEDQAGEPTPPSVMRRLGVVFLGVSRSTYGPTPTHRRSVEIGAEELAGVRRDLAQLTEVALPELERKLEAAGVPWTPGRPLPEVR